MPGSFKDFHPRSLVDIVDAIWDWDVADDAAARALTIKHPPGTAILLIAQYRVPLRSDWRFGSRSHSRSEYQLFATQGQTGVVSTHPRGPLGVIIVCLKPEVAARMLGAPLQEFADTKIELSSLFNVGEVILLEEMLAEARDSAERVAYVESFLLGQMRHIRPESAASRAALLLRRYPALPVWRLASELDISQRHLQRHFQGAFGTSPKQFARIARIEKVLEARRDGRAWVDTAYACGFTDQAHMINEFNRIIGQPPEDFFRTAPAEEIHTVNANFRVTYAISCAANSLSPSRA
jgi:AraC-like DNA-binding protein